MNDGMERDLKKIRWWLKFFIIALVLSGVTAFALETEMCWLVNGWPFARRGALYGWTDRVYRALRDINVRYPFLAYGYDWLAFAHLVIAVAFIGPLRDPVRNKWVIEFGMIACVMVFPLAFIAGAVRGIPIYWRLIDCSFGIVGLLPLTLCYRRIRRLERSEG
jgi:ABC-type Co2+ transport system permease subunit